MTVKFLFEARNGNVDLQFLVSVEIILVFSMISAFFSGSTV